MVYLYMNNIVTLRFTDKWYKEFTIDVVVLKDTPKKIEGGYEYTVRKATKEDYDK